jgi:predicted dehydrogenase
MRNFTTGFSMPTKLGIVGLKGHQYVVLNGARAMKTVEVVAVSDDQADVVKQFPRRETLAKDAKVFTDWEYMIDHTEMDVCLLCDANHLHARQLVKVLERNLDIVTEKPLALNWEEFRDVKKELAKSKSRMTMLLTMRHENKYPALREIVQSGAIGEICQITAQKSYQLDKRPDWFKKRETLGGIIPYIGIHVVDLIRWTTGLDFKSASAFHGLTNGIKEVGETESNATVAGTMSNGATYSIRLDYLRPQLDREHGDDRLRIAGTKGVIEVRGDEKSIILMTKDKKRHLVDPGQPTNLFVEYMKALDEKKPWPISAEDSLRATEIVLHMRDAADKKTVIEIPAMKQV